MRRLTSLTVVAALALSSLAEQRPLRAGQEERPQGGSPGNQPPPPVYTPPVYTPPPPVYTPPPPVYTPPPSVGVSGTVTVNPPPSGPPVYAQPPPTQPGVMAGLYEVYVRDDVANMVHRISFTDGRPIAACTGNCTFRVPPGQYVIEVDATSELRAGKKVVNIAGPTVIDVSPGSKSTRTTGLVLGILGPIAIFTGMIGALVVSAENHSSDFDCRTGRNCEEKSSYTPWVVLLLGGVGATTAGWIMFGTSSTKFKPGAPAPMMPSPPPVALAVVPTHGGAAIGLTVPF